MTAPLPGSPRLRRDAAAAAARSPHPLTTHEASTMTDHGTAVTRDTLRIERLLPGPIERVWRYLTDPALRGIYSDLSKASARFLEFI